MSYFDQGVVFGAGYQMPGVGVSPQAPGSMGLSGPNVPYIQWAPTGTGEQGLNPVRNFLNSGVPTSTHIHSHLPSNDSIVAKYVAKPWLEDDAHLRIREGMLIFATTELDPQIKDLSNIVSLSKMNEILYRQHHMFQEHANRIPELATFKQQLDTFSEKQIRGEIARRNRFQPGERENTAMNAVIRGMNQSVMRYQTTLGIVATWNFIGGVLSVSDSTTGDDMYSMDGSDKVVSIAAVLGKRCMLGNVWGGTNDGGNVDVGSTLWLILRRRQKPDGTYGEFQYYPYATKWRDGPPRSMLTYGNPYTGDLEEGVALFIGTVTLSNRTDPAEGFRQTAAGIGAGANVQASYEAHAKIPDIEVQIGM